MKGTQDGLWCICIFLSENVQGLAEVGGKGQRIHDDKDPTGKQAYQQQHQKSKGSTRSCKPKTMVIPMILIIDPDT